MPGFVDLFNSIQIDIKNPKFGYISNYTKFQAAKAAGKIDISLEEAIEFLKFEVTTRKRPLVTKRLFDLAMNRYKQEIAEEFFKLTDIRV